MSIEFLSLIFVVRTLFTLPTCFIKFIFLFTNFFNFPDLSSKIRDKNSIDILVLKEKLSLNFNEDVNLGSQKERILQKIGTINKQITSLNNKLKNKAYVTNAPKEIVQNDKNLVKELTIEDGKLRSIVSSIN